MRSIFILFLSLALATASAGCFGGDDDDGGSTPPTTTPTGTTPTTPTGPTPTTPTDPTPTTPTPAVMPRELCALTFDFQNNVQPGPPPTEVSAADCGTVPDGYRTISLNGNFTSAEPAILTQGVTVSVLDAAGTAVLSCTGPGAGPASAAECMGSATAMPGAYTIQYDGAGNIDFAGSVTIS